MQRREVGDVPAEPGALFHVGIPETLVGAPLTYLGSLVAVLDALPLLVCQAIYLVDRF